MVLALYRSEEENEIDDTELDEEVLFDVEDQEVAFYLLFSL